MQDPVICKHGAFFDRKAIVAHLEQLEICPFSGSKETMLDLRPCIPLQRAIRDLNQYRSSEMDGSHFEIRSTMNFRYKMALKSRSIICHRSTRQFTISGQGRLKHMA
jgi:hypothetical protein